MRVRVEQQHPRWHDKSVQKPFTCSECGSSGYTGEADAICEECGAVTCLPIEVEMTEEEYEMYEEEGYADLQRRI